MYIVIVIRDILKDILNDTDKSLYSRDAKNM